MPTFNIPANPLLDSFQKIYRELEGSSLKDEVINACGDSINTATQFFQSKENEAILLALLLQLHFNGSTISMGQILAEDFIQSREERYRFISDFTQEKHPFSKKGLIKKVADDFIMSSDHFEYTDKVIQLIDPGASRSKSAVKYKMLEKIEASAIAEKMLIYPLEQQASVEKLQTLLTREELRLQKNTETLQRSIGFVKRSDS